MSDYAYIQNYSRKGSLGISRKVFAQIALEATSKISGVEVNKKEKFKLYDPIKVVIHHDGEVDIRIDVCVKKGSDIKKIADNIQKEVKLMLDQMAEQAKVNVNIRVSKVEK